MDILIQDLRFALRSLRRNPGFTGVVVAVLALGIGVNTMIFSMVYGVLFRPWPLPQPSSIRRDAQAPPPPARARAWPTGRSPAWRRTDVFAREPSPP